MKTGKPENNKKAELRLPSEKNGNGHLTADDGKQKGKKTCADRDFIFGLGIGKHKRKKDLYSQRFYIWIGIGYEE